MWLNVCTPPPHPHILSYTPIHNTHPHLHTSLKQYNYSDKVPSKKFSTNHQNPHTANWSYRAVYSTGRNNGPSGSFFVQFTRRVLVSKSHYCTVLYEDILAERSCQKKTKSRHMAVRRLLINWTPTTLWGNVAKSSLCLHTCNMYMYVISLRSLHCLYVSRCEV